MFSSLLYRLDVINFKFNKIFLYGRKRRSFCSCSASVPELKELLLVNFWWSIIDGVTENVTKFLKNKNCYVFTIDPNIIEVERDTFAEIVENGSNNYKVIESLKKLGYTKSEKDVQIKWTYVLDINGRNSEEIKKLMNFLSKDGVYEVSEKIKEFSKEFYGNYATKEEVYKAISNLYDNKGYLIDTHTAVAEVVYEKYVKETGDNRKALIASTASPYKFPRSICCALNIDVEDLNDFEVLNKLYEETKIAIPKNLLGLDKKKILHEEVWEKSEMKEALLSFLK